jgi:hypothetical protein
MKIVQFEAPEKSQKLHNNKTLKNAKRGLFEAPETAKK